MPHSGRLLLTTAGLLLTAACHSAVRSATRTEGPDTASLARDLRYLASNALEGRLTGTAGNDTAAAYIARRFRDLGLRPVAVDTVRCGGIAKCEARFEQRFVARAAAAAHAGLPSELPTQNVVGMVPGKDPTLRAQYIIVGAHFDHLGRSSLGALDPDKPNEIHNGADDNASGTAMVLELARLFRQHPARRSIVLVTFSGEELGLLGSQYFVEHSPVALDSVQGMVNFDMVGRMRGEKLIVYGVATATEMQTLLNTANTAPPLVISGVGDGFGPSDQSSFYARNLPVLHFFTDLHDDYHRATDDWEKINVAGMGRVAAFAERVIREMADRPARLTFVRAPVTASATGSSTRPSSQVYLGSVPDMGASDGGGLRLTAIRPGSPADSAGLKAGDVIVELEGAVVKDLYTYSDALYSHQPGETVSIVVLRDGKRVTFRVKLGKRAG